jgi:predicted dehydrogenase
MDKVRWGVLSTARIGTALVIPGMQQGRHCEVTAIASRQLDRAQAAAQRLGIPKAYGAYEDVLADPDVDAVYIPLPNDQHVPWSIKTLEAGKHVLCEKPIALSASEAMTLLDASARYPHLKAMEAFMYRSHPLWQRAAQLVAGGAIGEVRSVQSFCSYFNVDPSNIRNSAPQGGGGVMDIGCYAISMARLMFGDEPRRVCGMLEYDPRFGTDRLASGMLEFERGTATFTCSTQLYPYQRVNVFGTTGRLDVEIPINAPSDRPTRMWHAHDATVDEIDFDVCNQFTRQGDAFSRAVLDNTPVPTPLQDAVANMRVIDAVVLSSRERRWVNVDVRD